MGIIGFAKSWVKNKKRCFHRFLFSNTYLYEDYFLTGVLALAGAAVAGDLPLACCAA